ncbi:MAG: four helix bundle protein [Cyclobacteriaceae bacterium]
MEYKFEKLQVWQLSMDLLDFIYDYVKFFPEEEKFNLKTQMIRAGTSISLNIAEGSTGNSDAEQSRFLKMSSRSLIETIACRKIVEKRNYVDPGLSLKLTEHRDALFIKLQSFIKSLRK